MLSRFSLRESSWASRRARAPRALQCFRIPARRNRGRCRRGSRPLTLNCWVDRAAERLAGLARRARNASGNRGRDAADLRRRRGQYGGGFQRRRDRRNKWAWWRGRVRHPSRRERADQPRRNRSRRWRLERWRSGFGAVRRFGRRDNGRGRRRQLVRVGRRRRNPERGRRGRWLGRDCGKSRCGRHGNRIRGRRRRRLLRRRRRSTELPHRWRCRVEQHRGGRDGRADVAGMELRQWQGDDLVAGRRLDGSDAAVAAARVFVDVGTAGLLGHGCQRGCRCVWR